MLDILTLGEILIDFSPMGKTKEGMNLFAQNPGGAPLNVAAVFAKYKGKSAFMGKVGDDIFGHFLKEYAEKLKIDCKGLVFDKARNTTLAFVALDEKGERDFAFYRKNQADISLEECELNLDLIRNCKIFHFGSLSMISEPSKTATLKALELAKNSGAIISYDPNYRSTLWDKESAVPVMKSVLSKVDMLKVSEQEAYMLSEKNTVAAAAAELLSSGTKFIAVTMGEKGAYFATDDYLEFAPAFEVNTIDTTGAGDVFWGSFLFEFLKNSIDVKDNISVKKTILKANYAAALSTQKTGAIPSIPDYSDISPLKV